MRELEASVDRGTSLLEVCDCRVEIVNPVQHDRSLTLEVAGEQQPGATLGQPHLGDPRSEGLNCEDHLGTNDVAVEGQVAGHVRARHVEEVEGLDPHAQTTGP
jgi:hypothetical protein